MIGSFGAEQRDIGRRIAPGDGGGHTLAAGQRDGNVAFVCERLVGSYDEAGFPDEARRQRPVRMDRDDRRCDGGH